MKDSRKLHQNMPVAGHDKKEYVTDRKQSKSPEHSTEQDAPAKRAPSHDVALIR